MTNGQKQWIDARWEFDVKHEGSEAALLCPEH